MRLMTSAQLAWIRAALDAAEVDMARPAAGASGAEIERHFEVWSRANVARLMESGFGELAGKHLETASHHAARRCLVKGRVRRVRDG